MVKAPGGPVRFGTAESLIVCIRILGGLNYDHVDI